MINYFPGTKVERENRNSREFLFGVFTVTNGFMLSHIREITGLDTPILQNWITREYVPRPINKRYSVNHVARILLINMLRDVLKIEDIIRLLDFITGKKTSKEIIISEEDIYNYVCDILDIVDFDTILSRNELQTQIVKTISNHIEPVDGVFNKILEGLEIILIFYASAIIKNKADKILIDVVNEYKEEFI